MMGFGNIGEFAIGEVSDGFSTPLTFKPVSRIVAGGFSTGRPAQVAVLGLDLLWDDESIMVWDDDTAIGWEA